MPVIRGQVAKSDQPRLDRPDAVRPQPGSEGNLAGRWAPFAVKPSAEVIAAKELQEALETHGIASDVHDGYGLALVSVWVGLVVWCDGARFWWRTGWDARRGRFVYAWHSVTEPDRAARRVTFRYRELRETHPLSELIAESMS